MDRAFKGVWIPKEIWLARDLSWTEKFLLTEIDSLSKNDECFASNEHFAKFFNISKDRVSKLISSLCNKGYAEVKLIYKPGTKQVQKRIITTIGYRQKRLEGIGENNYTSIGENNEGNNTVFNNTTNNTKEYKTSRRKQVYDKDSIHYQLALRLYQNILVNDPDHKQPNLHNWANDVRLMMERDNRTEEQISYIMDWCQNHSFWKSNILSTSKLREKFGQLVIQIKEEISKKNHQHEKQAPRAYQSLQEWADEG